MNNSEKLVIITAVFVAVVGILTGLSIYVNQIDISTVPNWALPIVRGAIGFFAATPIIFALSYFRNILGYLRNWVTQQGTLNTEYELSRYRDTIFKYIAIVGPFAAAIPPPYQAVGTAIGTIFALIVDVTTSEWAKKTAPIATAMIL